MWGYRIPHRFIWRHTFTKYTGLSWSEFVQLLRNGRTTSEERFERYVQKRQVTRSDFLRVRIDKTFKAGSRVTGRNCNQKCVFCHEDSLSGGKGRKAVDNGFFVHATERLYSMTGKPIQVHIAGNGEPTLTLMELVDLVRKFRVFKPVVSLALTTNGLLLGKLATDLSNAGLSKVNVSLHSLNRDTYRSITGVDGLSAVLHSLQIAVQTGLDIKINCVITGSILAEIHEYIKLASDLGIPIKMFQNLNSSEESMKDVALMLRLLSTLSSKEFSYAFPHNGKVILVEGAVIDFIDDSIANSCVNLACHSRSKCNEGCRSHIRLSAEGLLQPCPALARTDNIVDLTDRTITDEKILIALRNGGKLL